MNFKKQIFLLCFIFFAISCGRSTEVLEKECKSFLLPLLTLTQGEGAEGIQEYEEKKFTVIFSYYGCMANAKLYGTENPF